MIQCLYRVEHFLYFCFIDKITIIVQFIWKQNTDNMNSPTAGVSVEKNGGGSGS